MNFRMTKICNLFNWCERTVRSLPDKSGRIEIVESIKEKINNNNWGHEQGAEQTLYRNMNLTSGQHITFKLEETYSFTWNAKHRKKKLKTPGIEQRARKMIDHLTPSEIEP